MKKLLKSKRSGSAIPLVVVAIIVLLAMGVGLLSLGFNGRIYSLRTASDIKARCAADAGLTMALFEMNQKLKVKPWNDSTLPYAENVKLPYYDATCSYKVIGNLAGGYTLQSVGQSGEANRAVSATIRLKSAFDNAILTKNKLTLKSNTIVDGYNSLDPTDTDIDIDIGSQNNVNDTITLNVGVVVKGDVFVAPGANLSTAVKVGGGTVNGDIYTAALEPLPPVVAPAGLLDKGAINVKGGNVTITPADSGSYSAISLAGGNVKVDGVPSVIPGILEVSGGDVVIHVTGDIQLDNLCEIIIKEGSSLTIYTDGNIHCRNGSSISTENPPEVAASVQIYGTSKDKFIDIKAKSDFTGAVYAPDSDVVLYAKGNAYGSIVADNFNYMAGGSFNYDKALQKKNDIDDEAVIFVVNRWYESAPVFSPDIKLADIVPMLEVAPVK